MGAILKIVRIVVVSWLVFKVIQWIAGKKNQQKPPAPNPNKFNSTIDLESKGRKKDSDGNDVETFGP